MEEEGLEPQVKVRAGILLYGGGIELIGAASVLRNNLPRRVRRAPKRTGPREHHRGMDRGIKIAVPLYQQKSCSIHTGRIILLQ